MKYYYVNGVKVDFAEEDRRRAEASKKRAERFIKDNWDEDYYKNYVKEKREEEERKKKKAVKEAVLDWYEENGIEIDDYELGRIDSFVENYIEKNF